MPVAWAWRRCANASDADCSPGLRAALALRRRTYDLRRLRFIRAAQAAGFTLEQIDALTRLDASEDRAPARALAVERIAAPDARIAEFIERGTGWSGLRAAARTRWPVHA